MCPAGTSTGLLGSFSISDCGCKAGSIDIGDNGTFNCVPCSEGLDCPLASTVEDLKSGHSSQGSELAPWFHVASPKFVMCNLSLCPHQPRFREFDQATIQPWRTAVGARLIKQKLEGDRGENRSQQKSIYSFLAGSGTGEMN